MKKKNQGLKAVLCLAAATVAIGGASIAVSHMAEKEVSGGTELTVTGDTKVQTAKKNADGTYTLTIVESGFAGEMLIEAVYSADGKTLVSYDVLSHTETQGYGSKVDEAEYKRKLAGVTLPIAAAGMDISAILGIEQETGESTETTEWLDGVYEVKGNADDAGNYAFVTVTVADGKIVSAVWDEMYQGTLKSELSKEGKYVMRPIWATQAESVGNYVVEHQGTDGIMDANGYTDAVSGVSVNIAGAVGLIDQAIAEAKGKDGVYEVKGTEDESGNYTFVTVTVENGKISSVVWDEMYQGALKSELSKEGKYVMRPIWATQAEAVGNYLVEHQTTAGIMNDNGYTDAVSGVSVNIAGAVELFRQALAQASSTGEIPSAGTFTADATTVEVVSGATFSSRAVIRAVDEGYVWLLEYLK